MIRLSDWKPLPAWGRMIFRGLTPHEVRARRVAEAPESSYADPKFFVCELYAESMIR